MLLLLPVMLPSWHEPNVVPRERPLLSRRHALSAAVATALALPATSASARYGDFAKTDGTQGVLAAGDSRNECLFATPGTGLCQVYKSSQPALWDSPDLQGMLRLYLLRLYLLMRLVLYLLRLYLLRLCVLRLRLYLYDHTCHYYTY